MIASGILFFICAFFTVRIVNYLWKLKRSWQLTAKVPRSDFKITFIEMLSLTTEDIFWKFFGRKNEIVGLKKTWIGPILFIDVNLAEDVKIVMNAKECVNKPYFVQFINIDNGLLFSNVESWHKHRKIMSPYFNTQSIRTFIPTFNEKSRKLVKSVGEMEDKGDFNVFSYMAAMALETVLTTMECDVDLLNKQEEGRSYFVKHLEAFMETICLRMQNFFLHFDIVHKQTSLYTREIELRSKVMTIISNTMENVAKKVESSDNNNKDDSNTANFIRELMNPKHNLSDLEVSDEIFSTLIGAQDTSSITTSWILLYLGIYKDVQDKVVQELLQVFGTSGEISNIDHNQAYQLKYLEMVINEILRLQPPVPIIMRESTNEVATSEGFIIPKNTYISIRIFNIHRNPIYWGDDADQFRPERFENISKIHPYAFLPFTKGFRMCLGWRYAMLSMKIQLAYLLIHYEVDTKLKPEEFKYHYGLTMNLAQGHMISIKKRKF